MRNLEWGIRPALVRLNGIRQLSSLDRIDVVYSYDLRPVGLGQGMGNAK